MKRNKSTPKTARRDVNSGPNNSSATAIPPVLRLNKDLVNSLVTKHTLVYLCNRKISGKEYVCLAYKHARYLHPLEAPMLKLFKGTLAPLNNIYLYGPV